MNGPLPAGSEGDPLGPIFIRSMFWVSPTARKKNSKAVTKDYKRIPLERTGNSTSLSTSQRGDGGI